MEDTPPVVVLAAETGKPGIVLALLQKGADVNGMAEGRVNALMRGKGADVARLLISSGLPADAPDASGWTALTYAAHDGDAAKAETLLRAGADVNRKTPQGETPLSIAVESKQQKVIGTLRRFGAK